MHTDVDAYRGLLLALETHQRSPPEPIFVGVDDLARELGRRKSEISDALDYLSSLDLIEGPGAYRGDWIFRKLTRRGAMLMDRIRDPDDWRDLKEIYAPPMSPP